jgi:cytoplasmic tRNA 2-thiolation protein 1
LDYFSTECVYSPEAFRGSARALIKDLEKIRPSSILDIVKSGEDMAQLVPPELIGSSPGGQDEDGHGCASASGRSSGGEMATLEKQLAENEDAAARETEITLPSASSCTGMSIHDKKRGRKKVVKQVMGQCEKCGYLSSQRICKACMLLAGLNKARPKTTIEAGVEDEVSSTTMMRQVGRLEISQG